MKATTPFTLKDDLRASLRQRGVAGGSTLGDFLNALNALGLTLDTPIASIEWGISATGNGRVVAEDSGDGDGLEIREGKTI